MNYFDSLTQFLDRSDRNNAEKFWANALVIQIAKGNIKSNNGKIDFQDTKNFESSIEKYYLGKLGTQHYFAVNLDPGDTGQNLRQLAPSLTEIEITMAMQATSLINWHETHQCCSRCGAKTIVVSQGWVRQCEVDGSQHFPRTDPAVIVLVTDSQNRLLLGRQKVWAEGKFSNFAGFVEPGETLEEAVKREVEEETGLKVSNIQYLSSQPWPFPASIMLAFSATANNPETAKADGEEIVELHWFTKDELRKAADSGKVILPDPLSVSRKMLDYWWSDDKR